MPDTPAATSTLQTSTAPVQGQPGVQTATLSTTQTTLVPAPVNPLMDPKNWTELGAFILLVAGIVALFSRAMDKRRKEDAAVHKLTHDAIEKEVSSNTHKINNERQRVDALERSRVQDVERIVKLELRQDNIEKSLARIENTAERNHNETLAAMKEWAVQFSESIREVRDVKPKS